MLDHVQERVLGGRVVQGRDVPEVHDPEPDHDRRPGACERAQGALHAHEPARGGAHDHPRQRQQQEQRRDVAEQHVLDHVGGEEIVGAEPVDRRHERREQGEHAAREGDRLERPGAAPAGLPARLAEAPDVDPDHQRERRQHGRVGEPLDAWVLHCHGIVAMARRTVARSRACVAPMLVPPLCWSCGGVARRREPLCLGCRRLLRRLGPEPAVLSGVRAWAPVAYAGPARDLVGALKFRGATARGRGDGGADRRERSRVDAGGLARAGAASSAPAAAAGLQPGAV